MTEAAETDKDHTPETDTDISIEDCVSLQETDSKREESHLEGERNQRGYNKIEMSLMEGVPDQNLKKGVEMNVVLVKYIGFASQEHDTK